MIEFDLEKYTPKETFYKQGVNCSLCSVRKKLIKLTSEEKVRQALINYLITEKGFPANHFRIEVPMSHVKKGEKR